ncbi:MAG: acyltransferase [Alphaproteobacteria bacterium]|nr:acyltransferase [Alphaproteobacteria bacterium]
MGAEQHRFEVLDGMRGIAALMVMLLHFNQQYHYPFLFNAPLAVDVFFVLSGFVISHAYAAKLAGGMSGPEFMARRVGRLFPLAAMGTLLGFAALRLMAGHGSSDFTQSEALLASLQNLFFIPHFGGGFVEQSGAAAHGLIFPGNSPLWSISFELAASAGFLALVRLKPGRLVAFWAISLAALLLVPWILGTANAAHPINIFGGWDRATFAVGFPRVACGFAAGMLVHDLWRRHQARVTSVLPRALRTGLGPCLLLVLILAMPWTMKGWYGLVAVVALAPAAVAWGAMARPASPMTARVMHVLGWLSFPVYCLHEPVLTITRILWTDWQLPDHGLLSPALAAGAVGLSLAAACAALFDRLDVQRKLTRTLVAALCSEASSSAAKVLP